MHFDYLFVTDIIVVFSRDRLGRETIVRKCIGHTIKVLLPLPRRLSPYVYITRVEAGSNTSTVTLRVVRGDEMGLKKAAP
jgi:hypothetical protein